MESRIHEYPITPEGEASHKEEPGAWVYFCQSPQNKLGRTTEEVSTFLKVDAHCQRHRQTMFVDMAS